MPKPFCIFKLNLGKKIVKYKKYFDGVSPLTNYTEA